MPSIATMKHTSVGPLMATIAACYHNIDYTNETDEMGGDMRDLVDEAREVLDGVIEELRQNIDNVIA